MSPRIRVGFLSAAEVVLRNAKKSLTCREIVERATQAGLLQGAGKTPQQTLYAMLLRNLAAEGECSRFKKVGPGLFELRR